MLFKWLITGTVVFGIVDNFLVRSRSSFINNFGLILKKNKKKEAHLHNNKKTLMVH
jgi:ABC-type polysaccharide/polyol phosphate export permease